VGTFAGFVLATLVMLGVGTSSALLWASLPIAVFLAAYAPAAISFAAGQAMFALMVVMLFNLMVPAGWEVGVVRVEAVVTGAVVALVAALIIWPKGASAALRAEIASHTRAARRLVEASFGALIGKVDPAQVDAARAATLQTRHRVDEALAAYVGERSAKHVPLAVWGLIARVPILMRLAADAGIAMQRANYTGIESGDPTLHYEQALVVVGASFSDMADRLDTPATSPTQRWRR
jgi:uncharacterized membrane protein YccC